MRRIIPFEHVSADGYFADADEKERYSTCVRVLMGRGGSMPERATVLRGVRVAVMTAVVGLSTVACSRFRSVPQATVPPEAVADRLSELWRAPGDVPRLDLFHGAGSPEEMPRDGATFRFVEKDVKGFSPGWDVLDARGTKWSVKLGPEGHSEVVASRILWALGYHQPPTYHVGPWTLEGGPEPGPQPAGRFRPEQPGARRGDSWSWERNPFATTREFRGLLVLMRIINNWDLLDRNNAVFEFDSPRDGPKRRYVVLDLGASFGKTHGYTAIHSGTRSDVEDFESQGFVEGVDKDGHVNFDDVGKWHRGLFSQITPEDVRWTCRRLAALSDGQWRDAFRAGGYDDLTITRYVRIMRSRMSAGLSLGNAPRHFHLQRVGDFPGDAPLR
jgi:hypothetical protein